MLMRLSFVLTALFLTSCVVASPSAHPIMNPIAVGIRSALGSSSNGLGHGRLGAVHPSRAATTSRRRLPANNRHFFGTRRRRGGRKGGNNLNDHVEPCGAESPISGGATAQQMSARMKSAVEAQALTTSARSVSPGGAAFAAVRGLHFWENMVCGAVSRSVAQTIMHPANTMKTIMQSKRGDAAGVLTLFDLAHPRNFKLLTRGAGAQFLLSVPHGAVNFAVLEYVRRQMTSFSEQDWLRSRINVEAFSPGFDFLSSAISTVCCSVVSTPQMMITDNIMAGTYPNLGAAMVGLASEGGVKGFYSGWWPGLAGKIPSYALTWTFFQKLKRAHAVTFQREPKDIENSVMGCMASAATVCIMIPLDTIKTRLVTQLNYPDLVPYKGIADCGARILKEEGVVSFYRGLAPRLISVVPMIGIQFGVYEFMKKVMLERGEQGGEQRMSARRLMGEERRARDSALLDLEKVVMEVAADDDQPFPAPLFGRGKRKAR